MLIARFQRELGAMGYKFQFITSPVFMRSITACSTWPTVMRGTICRRSWSCRKRVCCGRKGFTAVKHQREVGTGYFDQVAQVIQGSQSSTGALKGSTEEEQFTGTTH